MRYKKYSSEYNGLTSFNLTKKQIERLTPLLVKAKKGTFFIAQIYVNKDKSVDVQPYLLNPTDAKTLLNTTYKLNPITPEPY